MLSGNQKVSAYSTVIAGITLLITAFLALEAFLPTYPGIYILILDIAVEIFVGTRILRSGSIGLKLGNRARLAFATMFYFFAFADFAWMTAFYVLKLDSRLPLVAASVAGGYAGGFIFGTLAILSSLRDSTKVFFYKGITLPIIAITLPIAVAFLIKPFFLSITGPLWTVFNVGELLAIVASLTLLTTGLISLISSRNIFWSFFSSGVVSVIFADWAMRIEKILQVAPTFGVYEFFWSFGVFIFAAPFVFFEDQIEKIETYEKTSLLNNYKLWMTVLIFMSILFLSVSQFGNLAAIKFISIGCGLGSVITIFAAHILTNRVQRFSELLGTIVSSNLANGADPAISNHESLPHELRESYQMLFQQRIAEEKRREVQELTMRLTKARAEVSLQVAHDIRSPLTALQVVNADLSLLPESHRILVRSAVSRIQDIANHLFVTHKNDQLDLVESISKTVVPIEQTTQTTLLWTIIENIVSEKRLQFRSRLGVRLESKLGSGAYGLFANIVPTEMKRVLSNLINNAIEAIESDGVASVSIEKSRDQCLLTITDSGKGISPEVLSQLGRRHLTHEKSGGSGIGVYHARITVESWGGSLSFTSELGVGTSVMIRLPLTIPPHWFIPQLSLNEKDFVVVLDDDVSIHQVWKNRFKPFESKVKILHLSRGSDLIDWCGSHRKHIEDSRVVFLLDYELLGEAKNGVDLVEELDIQSNASIVTSRFEEASLLQRCKAKNIRIIPKAVASYVPISNEGEMPAC